MSEASEPDALQGGPAGHRSIDRPRTVTSKALLAGHKELWIEHDGDLYRLRLTASGKLYLTK